MRGVIINRFRGDVSLFADGIDWLEKAKTGLPVLGVVPYLHGLTLDAEDMLPRELRASNEDGLEMLRVVVPVLPHISNHTDFDALRAHPQVASLERAEISAITISTVRGGSSATVRPPDRRPR